MVKEDKSVVQHELREFLLVRGLLSTPIVLAAGVVISCRGCRSFGIVEDRQSSLSGLFGRSVGRLRKISGGRSLQP